MVWVGLIVRAAIGARSGRVFFVACWAIMTLPWLVVLSWVGDVSVAQIGAGIGVSSAVYRVSLSGGGPDSVVVKLPALAEEAAAAREMSAAG